MHHCHEMQQTNSWSCWVECLQGLIANTSKYLSNLWREKSLDRIFWSKRFSLINYNVFHPCKDSRWHCKQQFPAGINWLCRLSCNQSGAGQRTENSFKKVISLTTKLFLHRSYMKIYVTISEVDRNLYEYNNTEIFLNLI